MVRQYLEQEYQSLQGSDGSDPQPTAGFQRVVQRAILHVQTSGKDTVTGANVLVALFSERDSYAVYFLQQQDMSRLDAVSYISHGIGKGGRRLKSLGAAAREEISAHLGRPVHLFLHVKVNPRWDEDRGLYREIGLEWAD